MSRFGFQQQPAECGGSLVDRLAVRLEETWVAVLCGVFHQLSERVDLRERVLANTMQLRPEPIQLRPLGLIEHQATKRLVFAMKEGQSDSLIDRNDSLVAESRRE